MAIYQVQGPDGQIHAFEGPDGATQDQVLSAASQQFAQQAQVHNKAAADTAAWAKTITPTGSDAENFAAGAGKAVVDMGRGLGQLARQGIEFFSPPQKSTADLVTGGAGHSFADTLGLPSRASVDESRQLDAPLMKTKAGVLGNVAGNVAVTMLPAGAIAKGAQAAGLPALAGAANAFLNPQTYRAAMAAGGLMGALQPLGTGDSRLWNTGLSAVAGGAGQALVNGLGRIAEPVKNALSPQRQQAVDTLTQAGVPLDLSQVTGSPFWNRVRSALNDNIFTAGSEAEKRAAQQGAFNAAVGSAGGAEGTALTPDVIQAARDKVGGGIGEIAKRNKLAVTPDLQNQLAAQARDVARNSGDPAVANAVTNRIDDALALMRKTGATYSIPSNAADAADKALFSAGAFTKGGSQHASDARAILQAAADQNGNIVFTPRLQSELLAIRENAPPAVQSAIDKIAGSISKNDVLSIPGQSYRELDSAIGRQARGTSNGDLRYQLGQLRDTLRGAMDESISPADQEAWNALRNQYANLMTIAPVAARNEAGNVSPAALLQAVNSGSKTARFTGGGQLGELARAGRAVLEDKLPNSGTAARILAATAPGALIGVGTGLATGDWSKAAEYGATALAAPKAAQFLLNNPTAVNMLSQGINNPTARMLLTAPAQNALAGQVVRQLPSSAARLMLLPAAQQ